jgi:hypothetical protein
MFIDNTGGTRREELARKVAEVHPPVLPHGVSLAMRRELLRRKLMGFEEYLREDR